MEFGDDEMFKISVSVPQEYLERMMDAVDGIIDPVYPGYRRTFSYFPVKGTWIPLEGSSPFKGTVGRTETADEMQLEFIVRGKDLKDAVNEIVNIHPYEEPAIDIVRIYPWKDVVHE
ncbi:MAG: hypothetical protein FWD37_03170 [Methanomassiliicoccaceae archaeon]|nr:hypothetical protein [Methanomassiliicoccaceae archaeon]